MRDNGDFSGKYGTIGLKEQFFQFPSKHTTLGKMVYHVLYHVFEDMMHCQLSWLDVKAYHVKPICVPQVLAVYPN